MTSFASSPTEELPRKKLGKWFWVSAVGIPVSLITGPFAIIGIPLLIWGCMVELVKAAQHRTGQCPHCDETILVMAKESSIAICPACKHRLQLRQERLVDLT